MGPRADFYYCQTVPQATTLMKGQVYRLQLLLALASAIETQDKGRVLKSPYILLGADRSYKRK
jgi:hypothetical protein